jgi:hypothetical protein
MDMVAEISNVVEQWSEEYLEKLKASIVAKGNNANGDQFAASFKPNTETTETEVHYSLLAPSWYDVIDTGGKRWTKGKMPPVNSIMEWMAHKGIMATAKPKKVISNKPHKGSWHHNPKYSAQRSMAFAIAINIKKHGVLKRFGGKGSSYYSDVFNAKAYQDLNNRIITTLGNTDFLLTFIEPE